MLTSSGWITFASPRAIRLDVIRADGLERAGAILPLAHHANIENPRVSEDQE